MIAWEALSLPWKASLEEAWDAYCAGTVPIGACITDAAGNVIARGRNRILDAANEPGTLSGTTLAHAEINALLAVDLNSPERGTYSIYTTTEPCPLCLGAIYMSGMRRIYFACRDSYAGSTDLLGATPYLSRKPVKATGPFDSGIETLVMALAVCFELERGRDDDITRALFAAWEAVIPAGVNLGKELFAARHLRRLRETGFPAGEMVSMVGRMVEELPGREINPNERA